MDAKTASVLSGATNVAVVHLPGRRFPGSVIQGDSLHSLLAMVRRSLALIRAGEAAEAIAELQEVEELLAERLRHYEEVVIRHGFDLPYSGGS